MKSSLQNITADTQKDRKLVALFLPLLFLFLFAVTLPKEAKAQSFNPLISFSVESCTLDKALEKLFAEYVLNIAFSKAEMSKIRIEKYSCSYKSVEEVLTDLLKGTDYGFKKIGKQYVIKKNQLLVNDPAATITPPAEQQTEVVEPTQDVVLNKTGDTIHIVDSLMIIRTVMRYDTVYDTVVEVKHELRTDTVYEVKYKGWQIPWPKFKDNGWFITPSVTLAMAMFRHEHELPQLDNGTVALTPSFVYAVGLDGGYKHKRLSVGLNLAYRSVRYRFLLEKTDYDGDYYVNDTLDTYYTVHPAGDTTFQYILDSTYVPLTTTNYAYRDVNQLDYLNVGVFVAFDFVRLEHFRAFVKAGASLDFLVGYAGSLNANESPYHAPIEKSQIEPRRLSYYGGLGVAFKIVNRVELVPEVHYRVTHGSLYRADFPFDLKMHSVDFRLGLTYYF
jgi:hypothetical protein